MRLADLDDILAIRSHLESSDSMEGAKHAFVHESGRPYDSGASWIRWVAGISMVLVVVLVVMGVTIRILTSEGTDADPETGGVVVLAELRVPVTGEMAGYEAVDATVWQGSPAPRAEFDTSALGPDRSFTRGRPPADVFRGMVGDVVYLGDHDGVPMILHATEASERNPWDYVYEFVTGHGDRRLLDASFPCCAFSYGDGDISPGVWRDWPASEEVVAQWFGTPASTSVVAFEVNGEPVGVQRPIGGIVSLEVSAPTPYTVSLIAYDPVGAVLASQEDFPVNTIPDL